MIAVPMQVPRCEQVADRLSEYIDDELDAATASRVAIHLAMCPTCARFAAELGATVDALHWLARQDARIPPRPR